MLNLSESELLLWGGIAVMTVSVGIGIFCMVLFTLTGRRLKKKLEEEYGKPQK